MPPPLAELTTAHGASTMTIYLVRHASAGNRVSGMADRQRPLDDTGRETSRAITNWFGDQTVDSVYSSPAVRCRETVQPLAEARGLTVEIRQELDEGHHGAELAATVRRLARADVEAVLCSHGDLIPAMLEVLATAGVPLAGKLCQKGSLWILHTEDGEITEGRYQPPPG